MSNSFNVPILFIIFNRPDKAELVFKKIREIKPKSIFIAADGPTQSKLVQEQCNKTRSLILSMIDWKCELKTKFSTTNLGCKTAVSEAITWFFSNVNEGIILEDDCLPDKTFFYYCQNLLSKYRNDHRVMFISGSNMHVDKRFGNGSYFFSKYPAVWGWASWQRVWKNYDVDLKTFPKFKEQQIIQSIFADIFQQRFWLHIFGNLYKRIRDTWDHQLHYSIISQSGVSITPNTNLISNIGFDYDAVRTKDKKNRFANLKIGSMKFPLKHPDFMVPNRKADDELFLTLFLPMIFSQLKFYLFKVFKKTHSDLS